MDPLAYLCHVQRVLQQPTDVVLVAVHGCRGCLEGGYKAVILEEGIEEVPVGCLHALYDIHELVHELICIAFADLDEIRGVIFSWLAGPDAASFDSYLSVPAVADDFASNEDDVALFHAAEQLTGVTGIIAPVLGGYLAGLVGQPELKPGAVLAHVLVLLRGLGELDSEGAVHHVAFLQVGYKLGFCHFISNSSILILYGDVNLRY